jgi:hypothetical protein
MTAAAAAKRGKFRQFFYKMSVFPEVINPPNGKTAYLTIFITVAIILNTICLAVAYPGMPDSMAQSLGMWCTSA